MSDTYQDLANTTFPDNLDKYKIYQDVNLDNVTYIEQIQSDVAAHNFDGAKTILAAHPELNNVIATAALFQRYEDQIIAVERTWASSIYDKVTHVVSYKGDYSNTATYQMFNVVNYNNKSYQCISTDDITGVLPTNTENWSLLTIQGISGTGMAFYSSWTSTQEYKVQDCVPYGNKLYVCITANTNQTPSTSPDYWKQVIVVPRQIIWSKNQPESQEEGDVWEKVNDTDSSYETYVCQGNNEYILKQPKSNADFIKTSDGNNVQNFIDSKGQSNGVAPLGADGLVPKEYLNLNFSGKLLVHVTSSDGGSIAGTRVRIRNEQLGSNYVQSLDTLGNTTFSLLDNHTYYVVLLDYPSQYCGAAATVTITGGETQELDLVLKTEPDIVGWRENVATGEIEYTDGAADFQPMSMASGALDAGSWGQNWLCGMRPCLLKAGIV